MEPEIQIQLMTRYMRAAIRAAQPRDIHLLSVEEVTEVFHLVAKPAVTFPQWCMLMDYARPTAATAAAATDDSGFTDEQKEQNDRFAQYLEKWRKERWSTD